MYIEFIVGIQRGIPSIHSDLRDSPEQLIACMGLAVHQVNQNLKKHLISSCFQISILLYPNIMDSLKLICVSSLEYIKITSSWRCYVMNYMIVHFLE